MLEIGCGNSSLAETIFNYNPEQINILGLDISEQVISLMQEKHIHKTVTHGLSVKNAQNAGLHFEVANILDLSPTLCPLNSYNLIIDKGTSDTMQYRAPKDDSKILLQNLFTKMYALLIPGGTYVIISPKYSIKGLRSTVPWEVTRMPLDLESTPIVLDNSSNKATIYAHLCTKTLDVTKTAPKEWLVCPGCDRTREAVGLTGEKWRVHRKHCSASVTIISMSMPDDKEGAND